MQGITYEHCPTDQGFAAVTADAYGLAGFRRWEPLRRALPYASGDLSREDRGWVREEGIELLIYAAFMLLVLLTLGASAREHVLELPLFCITVLWALAYLIADMTSPLTLSFSRWRGIISLRSP